MVEGERFDLVIVGGGPTGLALAVAVAGAGLSVLVIERQPLPVTLDSAVRWPGDRHRPRLAPAADGDRRLAAPGRPGRADPRHPGRGARGPAVGPLRSPGGGRPTARPHRREPLHPPRPPCPGGGAGRRSLRRRAADRRRPGQPGPFRSPAGPGRDRARRRPAAAGVPADRCRGPRLTDPRRWPASRCRAGPTTRSGSWPRSATQNPAPGPGLGTLLSGRTARDAAHDRAALVDRLGGGDAARPGC